MAIPDDVIDDIFKPVESEVGVEIGFEDEGRRLDLDGLAFLTDRIWLCREYVVAVAAYAERILDPDAFADPPDPAMAELIAALSRDSASGIEAALDGLVVSRLDVARRFPSFRSGLDIIPYPPASDPDGLRFEFVAGLHENPTQIAFIAVGAAIPLTTLALVFGMLALWKRYDEQDCTAQARRMTDRRIEMLAPLHRREGRMTPELRASLQTIVEAGDAAERRCRSGLDRFDLKVSLPPRFTFEFGVGPAAGSGPAP